MIKEGYTKSRQPKEVRMSADLVVVGGGMAGVCCSLTAARAGIKVILVQDRPVLGGNASSEVRLWILGATSHMGNNNRWAREGGVIDEILVENTYRNPEGNPVIFDTILLGKISEEKNITLLLNTSVYEVVKKGDREVKSVIGFCSQNSTRYVLEAPIFCDSSGDGIVGFLSGASFRMGAEKVEEFGELFAPDVEDYGELLGHSLYFHTKDVGQPVNFVAPSYALKDVNKLARWRNYQLQDDGCRLWWVEYGGRLDTVHQTEEIKWQLWQVVYGIWDHVKNSGEFPEAANLTLEWVGMIPGKRESRRFIGDYMIIQQDVVEQREHYDAVAFGGWSIDLHPADGVFSDKRPCNQWHAKGVYQIPYRCYYSKDINNLFLAGRIISASHVAFASTRVMATSAHGGQAVGMAAALAARNGWKPRDLADPARIGLLQQALNRAGQSIPLFPYTDGENLIRSAHLECEALELHKIPFDGPWMSLEYSAGQLLPLRADTRYAFELEVKAERATTLIIEWRTSEKQHNYTPDVLLGQREVALEAGSQTIEVSFDAMLKQDQYGLLCLRANEFVSVRSSECLITGIVSVFNKFNKAVSNFGKQDPPEGIGVESFEFWTPRRRPEGRNIAMKISPPLDCFGTDNLGNGFMRPNSRPNAFVAGLDQATCTVEIFWSEIQVVDEIVLFFDTDYDHPMESTLLGHAENIMPHCVEQYSIVNCGTTVLSEVNDNHQTINRLKLDAPIETQHLQLRLKRRNPNVPISLFEVLCFSGGKKIRGK